MIALQAFFMFMLPTSVLVHFSDFFFPINFQVLKEWQVKSSLSQTHSQIHSHSHQAKCKTQTQQQNEEKLHAQFAIRKLLFKGTSDKHTQMGK